ncbi:MAG TPA: hypothetical protein DCO75_05725 [Fibrobacteres bacterium]|nr:hypothetical protein [Fibrobacterota bacterium]
MRAGLFNIARRLIIICVFTFNMFSAFAVQAQMRQIPAGTFLMGSEEGSGNEIPRHAINLSAFSIDINEITKARYDSCVAAGVCSPAHYDDGQCFAWDGKNFRNIRVSSTMKNPDYPVVCVTWQQAMQYCNFKKKRLPTEAQWEYAALAGRNVTYSWGNDAPNTGRCAMQGKSHPEKTNTFQPNPWGIHDMTGNVWEWTYDHYQPDYYSVSESKDPRGPEVGQYRTVRGGGWYSAARQLRIKNRFWFEPNSPEISIGFRCAE